jgi:hypothetical protein
MYSSSSVLDEFQLTSNTFLLPIMLFNFGPQYNYLREIDNPRLSPIISDQETIEQKWQHKSIVHSCSTVLRHGA